MLIKSHTHWNDSGLQRNWRFKNTLLNNQLVLECPPTQNPSKLKVGVHISKGALLVHMYKNTLHMNSWVKAFTHTTKCFPLREHKCPESCVGASEWIQSMFTLLSQRPIVKKKHGIMQAMTTQKAQRAYVLTCLTPLYCSKYVMGIHLPPPETFSPALLQ